MNGYLFIIIGFFLDIIFRKYLRFNGLTVNVLLLFTVEYAIIHGPVRGQIFGFFTGLIEDIFTLGIIGERIIARTVIGFAAGMFRGKFAAENAFFQIFATFVMFVIHGFIVYGIRILFGYSHPSAVHLYLNSLLNSLFAPLVFYIMKRASAG